MRDARPFILLIACFVLVGALVIVALSFSSHLGAVGPNGGVDTRVVVTTGQP